MKATPDGSMPPGDLGGAGPDRALEGLFDAARADGFSAAQSGLLWGRVATAIPLHPGAAGTGGGGVSAAAASGSLKAAATWVLGGSLIMASAGLTTVGVAGRALRVPDVTTSNLPAIAVANEPPSGGGETVLAPDRPAPQAPAMRVVALPHAGRSSPTARVEPAPRAETAARVTTVTTTVQPPFESDSPSTRGGAGTTRSEPAAEPKALTEPRPAVDSRAAPAPGSEHVSTPAAPAADPAVSEGALLLRARRVLPSNPEEALALTQQHARLYPLGALIPEREVLAIEALASLGRDAEARSALALFRQHYPRSPHLARLDALLSRP